MPASPPADRPSTDQIVARYLAGAPIRRIAADLGVSYSYVHRRLHYSGVTVRRRGGNHVTPIAETAERPDSAPRARRSTLD
ncbi:helix-turn-helix domain-containing protein [Solwaraspora sp. WMMA2056]|uniref:helix-turn-helix domain-containing protein n=1 Tax=Solwaraspora sp. WMMA2056 TaxID=3015161 RepID=UPI00259BF147|nr:helix-turn-helix domain-containing protein [Solwaraspora sp. WMMA2056]WJK38873.1 helix-turn-helix domain-containing protein [Solwaraspora sp. WMMA2056]